MGAFGVGGLAVAGSFLVPESDPRGYLLLGLGAFVVASTALQSIGARSARAVTVYVSALWGRPGSTSRSRSAAGKGDEVAGG